MSFPWKKVKNNRISKLVSDHLQNSQKRRDGSSLVVETGFPTSLVDLFIKNREKLKKPSKKKRQSSPVVAPAGYGGDEVISAELTSLPSSLEPPSPPTNSPMICPSPLQSSVLSPSPSKDVREVLVLGDKNVDEDASEGYAERADVFNGVFLIILKMFLVVVLALGTKRLALGITIAACFLFFMEYVRKHAMRPPSSDKAKTLTRFWRLSRYDNKANKDKSHVLAIEKDEFFRPSGSVQEIQAVEAADSSPASTDEIRRDSRIFSNCCISVDRLENDQDVERRKIVPEDSLAGPSEGQKMKKSTIKSKMKKFITIKFKTPRKAHKIERADDAAKDKDVSVRTAPELHQQAGREESETAGRFLTCSSSAQEEEDMNRVPEVKEKTTTNSKEGGSHKTECGPSLRFLAVLCPIILVGLVQSRVTAVGLGLSFCVLLKLCEPLSNYLS